MVLDPESFRGMSPSDMLAALLTDAAVTKITQTQAKGAACVLCVDTGLNSGAFCTCSAGATLAYQSTRKDL